MSRMMKDSGIKWIGEMPEDWNLKQIKKVMVYTVDNRGKTPPIEEDGIKLLEIDALNGKHPDTSNVSKHISKDTYYNFLRKYLQVGDILFATVGSIGKTSIVEYGFDYCIAQNIVGFRVSENDISLFWFYYMQSDCFQNTYMQYNKGNIQGSIKISNLMQGLVTVPPKNEQSQIANYLDDRCNLINQTIKKQKQVIEKLKEYKQSVITEAVTKGLDPNVPMKDSEIEWIGEIPAHWDIKQLSSLFCERKYKNRGNTEINVLSLSYGNIKKRNVETNMGLLPESFETYNVIEPGNIVLRLTDLQNDHKSLRCGFVKENGIITSAYVTLEKKAEISEINTEYFYRLLHMFDIKKGFYGMGDGVRQNLKFNGELNKLVIVIPTVNEQNEIVKFLNERCEAIDKAVALKEVGIQKLEEYKKSLIYECVTGKREVK